MFIPNDDEVDMQSKIWSDLEAESIYELISKVEVAKYNELDEATKDEFNDLGVPQNYKLLRNIALDLLKKQDLDDLRFGQCMQKFVNKSDSYIILSNNMDFLLGG